MRKIIFALTIAVSFNLVLALTMSDSYLNSVNKAKSQEAPLLLYFYAENHQECANFEKVINNGFLDFLQENFLFARIDLSVEENLLIAQDYKIAKIPIFIVEDFNPVRRDKMDAIVIEPINIFKGLNELYTFLSNGFISIDDYDTAYSCLKLIEDLPEGLGVEVKKAMKKIEPKVNNKISAKKNNENIAKAESYMKTAESNLKSEKYEKAYLYFDKVIELVPNSKLAEKAKIERNKIKDLVDKSKILK